MPRPAKIHAARPLVFGLRRPGRPICTSDVATLSPDDTTDDAIALIREHDIRRIPVVDGSEPVGIVTIGDLAVSQDQRSALADISAASPNN